MLLNLSLEQVLSVWPGDNCSWCPQTNTVRTSEAGGPHRKPGELPRCPSVLPYPEVLGNGKWWQTTKTWPPSTTPTQMEVCVILQGKKQENIPLSLLTEGKEKIGLEVEEGSYDSQLLCLLSSYLMGTVAVIFYFTLTPPHPLFFLYFLIWRTLVVTNL